MGFGTGPLCCGDRPSTADAEAILDAVIELGATLIDTADTYCAGPQELHYGERLVQRVLERRRQSTNGSRGTPVIVATKGGTLRTKRGWEIDGHPDRVYRGIVASYEALGGQQPIPLWQHHWPDPRYSIRETMRCVRRAVEERLIASVGVCNYSLEQLQEALGEVQIAALQVQYNFWHREPESNGLLEFCEQRGIAFLPWRPLGGPGLAERLASLPSLTRIAKERSVSPQQVTLVWLRSKSPCVLPIPGSRQPDHFRQCIAALDLRLDAHEVAALDEISAADVFVRERPAAWQVAPPLSGSRR